MVHSRNKGATGEREWAHFLTDHGFSASRGQQFHGGADSPDVKCEGMDGFHPEVKRVELFNAYKSLIQASDDGAGKIPYVAHRRNNHPWMVCLWAEDFLALVVKAKAYDAAAAATFELAAATLKLAAAAAAAEAQAAATAEFIAEAQAAATAEFIADPDWRR